MSDQDRLEAKGRPLSRRDVLKGAAIVLAGVAAGCTAQPPDPSPVAPTLEPSATATLPPPTATSMPPTATALPPTSTSLPATATAAATRTATSLPTATATLKASREDLMRIYPTVKSRLAVVRHPASSTAKGEEQTALLTKMLDAGLAELTGLSDAKQAWTTLFAPNERVGIKVNCISRVATSVSVALAVANRLHDAAGIPLENVVIYDRTEDELKRAGYTINRSGPGIRCYGTSAYTEKMQVGSVTSQLSDVLLSCDAIINLPLPKDHDMCGVSLAMKNHFGSIHNPWDLHANHGDPLIGELTAAEPIRKRARLIIGDALRMCPWDWNVGVPENALLFAFDPVAHDAYGRQLLIAARAAAGKKPDYVQNLSGYIASAAKKGLGADSLENTDLREVKLG